MRSVTPSPLSPDGIGVPPTARLVRWLIVVALLVGVGGLVWMMTGVFDRVHNTLIVVIFAILFAYVVAPPMRWLERRGVPLGFAGVLVYGALFLLALVAAAWLAPALVAQIGELARSYPHIVADLQREIADPAQSPLLAHLPSAARDAIAANAGKLGTLAGGLAAAVGTHAVTLVSGTTTALIDTTLVLGLSLLFISDLEQIRSFAVRVVPRSHRVSVGAFVRDIDDVVGGFVRGQVLLALAVSVAATIVLLGVGVPYAVLLGVLTGIVNIVPIVGAIAALVPVLIIAFVTVGWIKALIVAALFVVIFQIQQQVLTPVVVSRSVGVTPLVVFLAIIVGGEAYGILGTLLAIPLAGILRVVAVRLFPPDPAPRSAQPPPRRAGRTSRSR